jgi:quinol-cytochrome oxidoreductase complex cytochrome b subunit
MKLRSSTFFTSLKKHLIDYPTPSNLSYVWSFGFLLGLCLLIQFITGIFISMHYLAAASESFNSVESIMRNVNFGWLLRYAHANGASMFFLCLYIHLAKAFYYGSYIKPRHFLWYSGIMIFLLSMATAFIGYVLPFGQMSLWGATVITNFLTVIPLVGDALVSWVYGGFSVGSPTINRFFALHYFFPFLIASLVLIHLYLLHNSGSGNPIGDCIKVDQVPFLSFFYIKDIYSLLIFLFFFSAILFYYPNMLGHPDNYIEANSLITPLSIVPEWYFLPFYAILRSIPSKLGGVCAMLSSILVWSFLPYLASSSIRSSFFRPLFQVFFWLLISAIILLGWLGAQPADYPYTLVAQLTAVAYFSIFLLFWPLISVCEKWSYANLY